MFFALLSFAANPIQLVPDGTLIWHVLMIVIMMVLLNATLFKPINRILAERDARTRGALEEARKIFGKVDASIAEYERSLRRARTEGYGLLERQRTEAVRQRERQLAAAKEALGRQTSEEKKKITEQAENARITLSNEAWRIALEISEQMLRRPVRPL
ncbi:MAG: ATP synthase F0 subunit B [Pyrinomonadaceae bacterium]